MLALVEIGIFKTPISPSSYLKLNAPIFTKQNKPDPEIEPVLNLVETGEVLSIPETRGIWLESLFEQAIPELTNMTISHA
jgi:hypothetical protein